MRCVCLMCIYTHVMYMYRLRVASTCNRINSVVVCLAHQDLCISDHSPVPFVLFKRMPGVPFVAKSFYCQMPLLWQMNALGPFFRKGAMRLNMKPALPNVWFPSASV